MEVNVLDIKKGDNFRYVCDWDMLGKPILSPVHTAKDDAYIYTGRIVMIPLEEFGLAAEIDSTVEKIDGTN